MREVLLSLEAGCFCTEETVFWFPSGICRSPVAVKDNALDPRGLRPPSWGLARAAPSLPSVAAAAEASGARSPFFPSRWPRRNVPVDTLPPASWLIGSFSTALNVGLQGYWCEEGQGEGLLLPAGPAGYCWSLPVTAGNCWLHLALLDTAGHY